MLPESQRSSAAVTVCACSAAIHPADRRSRLHIDCLRFEVVVVGADRSSCGWTARVRSVERENPPDTVTAAAHRSAVHRSAARSRWSMVGCALHRMARVIISDWRRCVVRVVNRCLDTIQPSARTDSRRYACQHDTALNTRWLM